MRPKILKKRTPRLCVWLPVFGALLGSSTVADAVGTRTFTLETQEQFLGGDLHGVSVDSQGRVRTGWDLASLTLTDATSIWSALSLPDGGVLLGTGNHGKVFRIAGGQATLYAQTGQMAVTALTRGAGGAVFAATLPSGKIFRIEQGKVIELPAIAEAENIWALEFDPKRNLLYAATGPQGKLFAIAANGTAQLVFDSDEPNLVSLAIAKDGSGTIYAGSSGKGLIFKITGPGRASVLYDPPGDEVKALAFGKGGALFAIANEFSDPPDPPRHPPTSAVTPASPTPTTRPKPGKGSLFAIEPDGRAERLLQNNDSHYMSLAVDERGSPVVGTGVEGRVYTVDENHTSTLLADTSERQVGVIAFSGQSRFIATSDPPVFHSIRGMGGPDAVWTSKVLDAGMRATLGRLFWRSEGALEFSTRTGNSAVPDATWSDWSTPIATPSKTTSPPGRFVQIRTRFARDPHALLRQVELSFITDNARAVVTSIEAQPKGATPSSSSGSQNSTAHESIPSSGSEIPPRSSILKVVWKVDNPDSDQIRYRVQFRIEPQTQWRDLTKPEEILTKNELDWDTSSLAEGVYRLRVEASDETANPPERVTRHSLQSGPVLVDNTPPIFRALSAQGRRVHAEIVDGLGPITRVDFAIDGHTEWRPLLPKDGVFDEPVETIDTDLSSVLSPGSHLIALRAFDQGGNFVVRDIELK